MENRCEQASSVESLKVPLTDFSKVAGKAWEGTGVRIPGRQLNMIWEHQRQGLLPATALITQQKGWEESKVSASAGITKHELGAW